MKREIWCSRCTAEYRFHWYAGEDHKKVLGTLLLDCVCDVCNKALSKGLTAWAISMFRQSEYFPWESSYLEVKNEPERNDKDSDLEAARGPGRNRND